MLATPRGIGQLIEHARRTAAIVEALRRNAPTTRATAG